MTERDIINALTWIMGLSFAALGVILWALARWIVGCIGRLQSTIDKEMRAFDVRLARVEMVTGFRRGNHVEEHQHRTDGSDD